MQTIQVAGRVSLLDAVVSLHRGDRVAVQEKEYASFSSLIWTRVPEIPHCWRWKTYFIWGEGCTDNDVAQQICAGGLWFTNLLLRRGPYVSQQAAQAAVETFHLEDCPPDALMDLVDDVWELLEDVETIGFEWLRVQSGLDELTLSDVLARGYELRLFEISIVDGVGYRRAPKLDRRAPKL